MAIYTNCIRPGDYEDVRLFVSRPEHEQIRAMLTSFLDSPGARVRRLLVHGERGIGKSIGVRAAVTELEQERDDFFPVIVRGERCKTVQHLIGGIADELAVQIKQNFAGDKDLRTESSHLMSIMRIERTTRGKLIKRAEEIQTSVETDTGLLGFLQLKLGLRAGISTEEGTEETAEVVVDDAFRIEALGGVLTGITRRHGREPLVFVDNLDQITEASRVSEFNQLLLKLDRVPVVITVRSEFVSSDIFKEHRTPIRFVDLPPGTLVEIVDRRLEVDCRDGQELRGAGLITIARGLAKLTGNPYALLTWLEYLCWFTPLRRRRYRQDLEAYVERYHPTLADEVIRLARWYLETGTKRARRGTLVEALGLDEDDLDAMERQGAIIADDVMRSPESRRYHLAPRFTFLR